MNYFILEQIPDQPMNMRVIKCSNHAEAYKLWLESPISRKVVKEINLVVVEKP